MKPAASSTKPFHPIESYMNNIPRHQFQQPPANGNPMPKQQPNYIQALAGDSSNKPKQNFLRKNSGAVGKDSD
jgi:hypothetical protein